MPRKVAKKIEDITPAAKTPSKKFFFLGLAVIVIAIVLFLAKSLFLAAVVNGRPIFKWQLDRELEKRYGAQILDNLITEKLINQEAGKLKINTTKEDIDKELEAVKQTLPQGTDLETALKAQGMTMDDFLKQVKIKLQAEKILNPKITTTDAEIEEFASKSASFLTSTDSGKQKEEATTLLRQQKLGQVFNEWLKEIQSKAKILKFPL